MAIGAVPSSIERRNATSCLRFVAVGLNAGRGVSLQTSVGSEERGLRLVRDREDPDDDPRVGRDRVPLLRRSEEEVQVGL